MIRIPLDSQVAIRKLGRSDHPSIEKQDEMDIGNLTHAIVKNVKADNKMQATAMARKLMYCCGITDYNNTNSS